MSHVFLAVAPGQVCNVFICGSQALAPVDHDQRYIGFFECMHGLIDHELVNTFFTTGDAAGVDNEVWA